MCLVTERSFSLKKILYRVYILS